MSGRVEAAGYKENDEDAQIVSELMDDIRDAVTNYQVGGDPKPYLQVPSLRQLVQMAHQRAIYDQNRRLIVSPRTG